MALACQLDRLALHDTAPKLQSLPENALDIIVAQLSPQERWALATSCRALQAAAAAWWDSLCASLSTQRAATSLSAWLANRRPEVRRLTLTLWSDVVVTLPTPPREYGGSSCQNTHLPCVKL